MTVWFDVEDLFHYFRTGNKRISGIQRLTVEIYRAAHMLAGGDGQVRFVRHGSQGTPFQPVDWADIAAEFDSEAEAPIDPVPASRAGDAPGSAGPVPAAGPGAGTPPAARLTARQRARRIADRLPPEVRRPLVLAAVTQLQALGALGRFGVNLLLDPAAAVARRSRRLARDRGWATATARAAAAPLSFEELARPGDTLLVLGSPWFREEYSVLARWLRDDRRMRFGVLMHDLVPIRRPEWCHSGVTRTFREWYSDVLPFCDLVLANSRHTARDVEAYARESGFVLPGPVRVLPVGTGFGPGGTDTAPPPAGLPPAGSYVLFVSTVEARKNHALVVRVWRRLLDEVQAGLRSAGSVPDLVFAGRIGWLVADLVQQLENTAWLGGRIRMVQDPTDSALRALYRGSLFTIFPSLHEGWGLPVTESLALGKPCLSSDAAALTEAGGALCRYFDPEDTGSAHRAVAALLDDRAGLAEWQAQVQREFRPTPWTATAAALLDAVAALEPAA